MELKSKSIQLCIHNSFILCIVQNYVNCVVFILETMLSDKNWNTVYSLKIDIFEALPSLPFLSIKYCPLSFLFIENKSLMCGCTVLISIQFGL